MRMFIGERRMTTFRELRMVVLERAGTLNDHFAFRRLSLAHAAYWDKINAVEFERGYDHEKYIKPGSPSLCDMDLLTPEEFEVWVAELELIHGLHGQGLRETAPIDIKYLEFAIHVAKRAGEILMRHYGNIQRIEWKERRHFKTIADDESDTLIRCAITDRFPDHCVYSEELDARISDSEWKWVVDPLDGTIPYTFGFTDHFSVSIGLVRDLTPVVGVIYAPKRNELFYASQGGGAFCNGHAIHVSDVMDVQNVVMDLCVGNKKRTDGAVVFAKLLHPQKGIMAHTCSACATVPLALTARGNLHAFLATELSPWDMAAAVVILREAGGRVTNLADSEWKLGDESILAANPDLHTRLMRLLRE